eukprot:99976-Heterocapsa_arctica.AAC.1
MPIEPGHCTHGGHDLYLHIYHIDVMIIVEIDVKAEACGRKMSMSEWDDCEEQMIADRTEKFESKAETDSLSKVKKMLKDLKEANEEVEHGGWCDTELSMNTQTRKERNEAIETLYAETDELEALIEKLTEDIASLPQALIELDVVMSMATTLR